jgi:hypothetical protein
VPCQSQPRDINNPKPRSITFIALINVLITLISLINVQINQINTHIAIIVLINTQINLINTKTLIALIDMKITLVNMNDKIEIDLIPIEANNLTINKLPDSTAPECVNNLTVNEVPDCTA